MRLLTRKQPAAAPDESQALKELTKRVGLPLLESLSETGELRPAPGGVVAPQLQGPIEHMLIRFLRAEKLDIDKAEARLIAHAQWRSVTIPAGGIPDAEVLEHLKLEKTLIQPPGKKGQVVLIVRACKHVPCGYDSIKRFIIYSLDVAAALADEAVASQGASGKYQTVVDLTDLQLKNLDAQALRACFQVLQAHFPERLDTCFMYEAPLIFAGLWAVVRPFLDPVTQQKVKFVEGKTANETLLKELGADVLPKAYGGAAEPWPIERAAQKVRDLRKAQAQQHTNGLATGAPAAAAAAAAAAAQSQHN